MCAYCAVRRLHAEKQAKENGFPFVLDILDFGTSINHLNRPLRYRPARTRVVALLHAIDKRRPLLSKVMPEGVPSRIGECTVHIQYSKKSNMMICREMYKYVLSVLRWANS